MANNYLEQLAAEWYEFQGYFVRRNVYVGKLAAGGYECELDVVALNPKKRRLVHIEPSMDASSWAERERRFAKKFRAGRKHIPALFKGLQVPSSIEQIALLGFAGRKHPATCGGGRVVVIQELLSDILRVLQTPGYAGYGAVPEQYAILRTLQVVTYYPEEVTRALGEPDT